MSDSTGYPPHIPSDRVVDFDIFNPPGVEDDYFRAWLTLQSPEIPGLVWTTHNGGHWIATRGKIVRELWEDHEHLSNEVLAVTPGLGEVMQFIPLQLDRPDHKPFRAAVNSGFAFRFLTTLKPQITTVARELTEGLVDRGHCEFMSEYAEIFPVHIFLSMIDVPTSDRARLRELGKQLTRPDGSMTVEQLAQAADDYLRPYVEQRLTSPGDDLFSRILSTPVNGRAWTMEEAQRLCRNLLFGGLDTVVAMIGMITLHLARHPEHQRQLRDNPDLIPAATDEFIRRYPTVSVSRNLVTDLDVDGVTLKTGDIVYLPSVLHNLDPACFDAPEAVRFERRLSPMEHTTMGAGVHRCVGATLARMEISIFLEQWLSRMPEFRLDPDKSVRMKGGNVGTCTDVPLLWN